MDNLQGVKKLPEKRKGPNLKFTPMKRTANAVKLACKGKPEPKSVMKLHTTASEARNNPTPLSFIKTLEANVSSSRKKEKQKEEVIIKTADGPRIKTRPSLFERAKKIDSSTASRVEDSEEGTSQSSGSSNANTEDTRTSTPTMNWDLIRREVRYFIGICRSLCQLKTQEDLQKIGAQKCPNLESRLVEQIVAAHYSESTDENKEQKRFTWRLHLYLKV